jgi:hypothetical protein
MKILIQGAVATLFAASVAQAQQAVQWKVADGGNGHWYSATTVAGTWPAVRDWCSARGGHLVTASQTEEWLWVKQNIGVAERWAGGFQDHSDPSYSEPMGGWRWVTGEPFAFSNHIGPFDDCPGGNEGSCGCVGDGDQDVLFFPGCCANRLDDVGDGITPGCDSQSRFGVIEYSADCNNDGIVDYGQILQGQLADLDSNGVPDICQQPTCVDADIYRDFNVNGADLGILLSQWGPNTPLTESDLNSDGVVNGADLGILLSFWGPCP